MLVIWVRQTERCINDVYCIDNFRCLNCHADICHQSVDEGLLTSIIKVYKSWTSLTLTVLVVNSDTEGCKLWEKDRGMVTLQD